MSLTINPNTIVTYNKSEYNFVTSYDTNDQPLQMRQESLDLGVLFDSKFKFAAHFDYIMPMLCLDFSNETHHYSRIPTPDLRFILHLSDLN